MYRNLFFVLGFISMLAGTLLSHQVMINTYTKEINALNREIEAVKTFQQQYQNHILHETQKTNQLISQRLNDEKTNIDRWSATIINSIDNRLHNTISKTIRNSTDKAIKDNASAIRNTAIVLNQKFSASVSRDIVKLISNAERNRVALGECIKWADSVENTLKGKSHK